MFSFFSTDEINDINKCLDLNLEYRQLKAGNFSGTIDIAEHSSLVIAKETNNTALEMHGDFGNTQFLVGINTQNDHSIIANGHVLNDTTLTVYNPSSEILVTTLNSSSSLQIYLSAQKLIKDVESRTQSNFDTTKNSITPNIHPLIQQQIRCFADEISQGNESSEEELYDVIAEQLANHILDAQTNPTRPKGRPLKNSFPIFIKACRYINDNLLQQITIADLCNHCAQSQRNLERIFQHNISLSPKKYIAACKLHAIRHDLLSATPHCRDTVQSISAKYSIHHPGRFSQSYHSFFKERPLESLRKQPSQGKVFCLGQ